MSGAQPVKPVYSFQKRNPRHEVVEYMRALADARDRQHNAESALLHRQCDDIEFMQAFADALGICTEAPDWWELSIKKQREKMIARATMLRARAKP